MKVVVVFKEESEHAREVIDYLRDFERESGKRLETLNPDSPSGMNFCQLYDIVEYPSIVALSDDGSLQSLWRGLPLPPISEVSYYA